jgi:hypothetical protein
MGLGKTRDHNVDETCTVMERRENPVTLVRYRLKETSAYARAVLRKLIFSQDQNLFLPSTYLTFTQRKDSTLVQSIRPYTIRNHVRIIPLVLESLELI